jgi:predicted aspartyl protease
MVICASIKADCWYLPLTLGKTQARFLVDSGSEITIINANVFRREPALNAIPLHESEWIVNGIGGEDITVHGMAEVPIQLDERTYVMECLVADIKTAGVLGMNFLTCYNASCSYSKGELILWTNNCIFCKEKIGQKPAGSRLLTQSLCRLTAN